MSMYQDGIPLTFEQWLAIREPFPTTRTFESCDCCGNGEPISPDGFCVGCLRYQFGYDQAAEGMVAAMIAGMVRAALEAGASPGAIFKAAADAMDVHHADVTQDAVALVTRDERTRGAR